MQATEPKGRAAERLLRTLGAALKTQALYPLPHPMTLRAVANLQTALRPYMDEHGPFVARVSKSGFSVGGVPFKAETHANLAFFLYTRKISFIKIMPGVSEEALTAFVSIVGMDRSGLEAAGGVRQLIREAGIGNIQVGELALGQEVAPEPFDLTSVFDLLSRGRLAPQERERVVELLRAGPEQAGRLLEHAVNTSEIEGFTEDQQVLQIYAVLKNLDRLVMDEPVEDQSQLYASLATAYLLISQPLRTLLTQAMVSPDAGDMAARLLGKHLDSEPLAQLAEGVLGAGDVEEQVKGFLQAVRADPQKAKAVLSILDARLSRPDRKPGWLTETVWPQIERPRGTWQPGAVQGAPLEVGSAVDREDLRRHLEDIRAINESSAVRDVTMTFVDVLRHETGEKELINIADDLMGSLSRLGDQREFELLAGMLTHIKDIASTGNDEQRKTAAGILKRITEGILLENLLTALWEARDTPAEPVIHSCLHVLAGDLVGPILRVLGGEPRGPMRAMLCDLLVRVSSASVDDLGRYVDDERWYLVRNVVDVLGRLRSPQGVTYLGRLVNHGDYRVRREAIAALATIGTEDAQTALTAFLDDADERIRTRAMQSLDITQAWLAMPRLLALVEQRDFFNRLFALKRVALEVLVRLGARQSLPAIKKIARARLVFGQRGRELRRLARVAVGIIEGQRPVQDRAIFSAEGGADRP